MLQSRFEVYRKYRETDWHRAEFAMQGQYWHRISVPCQNILATIGNGKHLDIGAGTGVAVSYLRSLGVWAEGLEPAEAAFQHHAGLPIFRHSVYDLSDAYPLTRWDGISLFDVIEHLQWPERALETISRHADHLWITTPVALREGEKKGIHLRSKHHLREWEPDSLDDFVSGCIGWKQAWREIHNDTIYVRYSA